jgi:XTP/dITP diphosphohydrolase
LEKKFSLIFATNNSYKVKEVKKILKKYPVNIIQKNLKGHEIQSESVKQIAEASSLQASLKSRGAVFVEDTGLFIKALNGFPGPYASYVHRKLGNSGVLKLLNGESDRVAHFLSVVSFCAQDIKPVSFTGITFGTISEEEKGSYGFGFDPIFKPEEVYDSTFAEMSIDEKNTYSHRAKSIKKFIEWLSIYYIPSTHAKMGEKAI